MDVPGAEFAHPAAATLGSADAAADVAVLLGAHSSALNLVSAAAPDIASAVDLVADVLRTGGRLLYAGAGTSGWLAALDAAEVVATYGLAGRVVAIVAGGLTLDPEPMTTSEDDVAEAEAAIADAAPGGGDVLLALSASGRTPFTVAAAVAAARRGTRVVAIVGEHGGPIARVATTTITVPTRGELVAGSTRLAAGIAQKAVLNTISTAACVRAGRAYRGQMVAVEAGNAKLRARLVNAVAVASGCDASTARAVLEASGGRGDVAVVVLVGGAEPIVAASALAAAHGDIRAALADLADR